MRNLETNQSDILSTVKSIISASLRASIILLTTTLLHAEPTRENRDTTPTPAIAITAWAAVEKMSPGINIGNTFDCTYQWETGWGSPPITQEFIKSLAVAGFKSVRLPIAWDTYAEQGMITAQQFQRIDQIVDWIVDANMFCVINIHFDGGWINSGSKEKYPDTYHTFSAEAEKKFRSYWKQIADHFADKNEKLLFEAFNEETNFENEGSLEKSYTTLTRVNQLFIDTVRNSSGHNPHRLLIVPGYSTDIEMTCRKEYLLPKDHIPDKLLISVHFYTPWTFVGLQEDANWAKMRSTWGSPDDNKYLNDLFDKLKDFTLRNNTPVFLGEFSMCSHKDKDSSNRWTSAVFHAAKKRKMIPVLWDTGAAVSRHSPYAANPDISKMIHSISDVQAQ